MNKAGVFFVIVMIAFLGTWLMMYNSMAGLYHQASRTWSQLQETYKVRSQLVPSMSELFKPYMKDNGASLQNLISLNNAASALVTDQMPVSEAQIAALKNAQDGLAAVMQQFITLGDSISEMNGNPVYESIKLRLATFNNRIETEESSYAIAAKEYNDYIAKFPVNLMAERLSYKPAVYLESELSANGGAS